MGLTDCYTCIKYLMFAFNFLFWLVGIGILGVGIWVLVDPNFAENTDQIMGSVSKTAGIVFIIVGAIIIIIGFLGCCGAIRESQCMLGTFFIILFVIFAVLLGLGIYCVVQKQGIKELLGSMLQTQVEKYEDDPTARKFMDDIQEDLDCCGSMKGAEDYAMTGNVPPSCLSRLNKPCADKVFQKMEGHILIVAGVAIGIALIMILGMIFSMVLCCAIRDVNA